MLLVQPHLRDSQIVLPHIEPVDSVVELLAEGVCHERIFCHHYSPAAQPGSAINSPQPGLPQRNLHVFASPRFQLRVESAFAPPHLARCEHPHGDRRKIVRFRAAAPELAKVGGNRSRAADAVPYPLRDECVGVQAKVDEVYKRFGILESKTPRKVLPLKDDEAWLASSARHRHGHR